MGLLSGWLAPRGGGKRYVNAALDPATSGVVESELFATSATGGPVDMGVVATTGAGTSALSLVRIASLAPATTGAGVTAVALRRVGVLADATSGAGTTAVALRKIGMLSPASTGRSTLAVVLAEIGSLTVLTSGQSTLATSLIRVGLLTPATTGVSAVQATLTSVRTLIIATAGASALNVSIGGGHGLITLATSGSSDDAIELTNGATVATPLPSAGGFGFGPVGRSTRRDRAHEPRVLPFPVATGGASSLDVRLSTHRDPVEQPALASVSVTPLAPSLDGAGAIVRELAADPLDEWAMMVLLLEEAA